MNFIKMYLVFTVTFSRPAERSAQFLFHIGQRAGMGCLKKEPVLRSDDEEQEQNARSILLGPCILTRAAATLLTRIQIPIRATSTSHKEGAVVDCYLAMTLSPNALKWKLMIPD